MLKSESKTNKNEKPTAISSPKPAKPASQTPKNNPSKTVITIKYDIGFSNQFFIRGEGANLSWDKGQLLANVKPDEWVWETTAHFDQCEFKILINDQVFENGENHFVHEGASIQYTPSF